MLLAGNPENFDVIVTPDIYGDILSAVVISSIGGVGMAPSACIGDNFAFFEPIHGTAWDLAGTGIANPIASILSAKLMLEYLNETEAAQLIENAVSMVLAEGLIRTKDIGGFSATSEVGDAIVKKIQLILDGQETPLDIQSTRGVVKRHLGER
jgi:isocitrate/isopropylmalate dehydrogenase